MKKKNLALLFIVAIFNSSTFAQASDTALDDRVARMCANLRNGAFNKSGTLQINEDTCGKTDGSTTPINLIGKSEADLRQSLSDLGVKYLFNFNNSDLVKDIGSSKYSITDFMGNAVAESTTKNFTAHSCTMRDGTQSESYALFDRESSVDSMGGYLLVNEKDPTITNLKTDDGFTVGTWVKIKADYAGQSVKTATGYFPILSKTALNTNPQVGKVEWTFKLTSEVAYILINRNNQFQSNLNVKLPWWADRFGSCYENGIFRECWHFVAVSVNQTKHTYSVLFLRKFADELPGNTTEFFQNYTTSASEDQVKIEASPKTALRIGGSNSNTMDGLLKGVFFAKKALGQSEIRAIANLTTPSKEASLSCETIK